MKKYELSILIAVCIDDNEAHFKEALESIYDQCDVKKQVVLVADGPLTTGQNLIIRFYEELYDGFFCLRISENKGLAAAMNAGLAHCECELVARMDSDDICERFRFSRQLKFMNVNPSVAVSSGTVTEYCMELKNSTAEKRLPTSHDNILAFSRFRNPINHMACIFRKSSVLKVGGYPEQFRKAQDYALWGIMLEAGFKFANIDDCLVKVRAGNGLFKRRGLAYFHGELLVLRFLKEIGHISSTQLYINILVRFFVRLAPDLLKKIIYQKLRGR